MRYGIAMPSGSSPGDCMRLSVRRWIPAEVKSGIGCRPDGERREIRNPKAEIRRKAENRIPNLCPQNQKAAETESWADRIMILLSISGFGFDFRLLNFEAGASIVAA